MLWKNLISQRLPFKNPIQKPHFKFPTTHWNRSLIFSPRPLEYSIRRGVPPVFSAENCSRHWEHLQICCKKLNTVIAGTKYEDFNLEDIVAVNRVGSENAYLFNLSSSIYNHTLMFLCVVPGGKDPSPWMQGWLNTHFGGEKRFKDLWKSACKCVFGSGWCWLILYDGVPLIVPSQVESNPVGRESFFPILNIDLWEHAYYADYGNNRNAYIDNWLAALNWEYIEEAIKRVPQSEQITPHFETNLFRTDERVEKMKYHLGIAANVNPFVIQNEEEWGAVPSDIPDLDEPSYVKQLEAHDDESEDTLLEEEEGEDTELLTETERSTITDDTDDTILYPDDTSNPSPKEI
jgi:Fe-Mn family superoxide dismutase